MWFSSEYTIYIYIYSSYFFWLQNNKNYQLHGTYEFEDEVIKNEFRVVIKIFFNFKGNKIVL